jgi:PAS domain S-box-containing protein
MSTKALVKTENFDKTIGNILIVDDRPDIIHVIEMALEDYPVRLYSAINGREALDMLRARQYDLLLLDARLPDISGPEICRRIKNDERWRMTKVIVISASTQADDKLRAFDAGADDYVTKPFRVQELRARVQVMLNLRQAERELTRRNEQLLEIIQVSARLNTRLDLQETADLLVKSACRLTIADQSYIMLWNEEAHYHYYFAAENPYAPLEQISKLQFNQGVGISSLVQETGQVQIVEDYRTFERAMPQANLNFFGIAALPLRTKDRYYGCLLVTLLDQDKQFEPEHLEILTTLANQGSIAIENAQLYTELAHENEKYRMIAENASDLILSLDASGNVTYVNEVVKTLLGYAPEDLTGSQFVHFLTNEGKIVFEQLLSVLGRPQIELTSGLSYELAAFSNQGATVNLEFKFGQIYRSGNLAGIQGIGRDITARKRSEQAERMRMVGQIASGVAHDLNNVLANVLGHAQLLKEVITPDLLEPVQIIEQSAKDGAETVRRIQEFSVQRMSQNLEVLDLDAVVQSAIDITRPRWRDAAQQKGMRVEVERELTSLPLVQGKAAELREVLVNLIHNSLDAMRSEGGKITFTAAYDKKNQMVTLEVADNGRGMTPEIKRHVFELFYTTKGVRGTGLGLSVAYGIIRRFGGDIWVDSTPDVGTTFYIRLPAATPDQLRQRRETRPEAPRKIIPQYQGRILVVDDEANLRLILQRTLRLAGFQVEVAVSGVQALEMLGEAMKKTGNAVKPYDLIFSDLGMPEMSGWELAQEISTRWSEIPVVLVTGWGEQLEADKLAEHNIAQTISKPFDIEHLITTAAGLIPQAS